jgi:cytidine deaminase
MPTPLPDERALLEQARSARKRAYAPYSRFAVGAALLAEDGTVVAACNVENASYEVSTCAEQAAVAAAIVKGHRRFVGIAVASSGGSPMAPCGACRQVLYEFVSPGDLVVLAVGESADAVLRTTLGELFPHGFEPESVQA